MAPHLERCEQVTGSVLHAVFNALAEQRVMLEGMLLKPNMVTAGAQCSAGASVQEVAMATLRCLRRHVPAAVPGIVFLSGGQEESWQPFTWTPSTVLADKTLDNQLFVWACPAGSSAEGVAWARGKPDDGAQAIARARSL